MRKIFFALILNFFFICAATAADNLSRYKEECQSFIKPPKVELFSSYGKLRYRFDKDASYLKRETAKKFAEQNEVMDEDFAPIGLTKVRDIFDLNFTVETLNLSHGYTCVYPETISARLEYSMPTIYLLNSLKEGTCLYKLAYRHEQTHMQIYIEALDYFLPRLKRFMEQLYDRLGFVVVARGESVELAAQKLNANYLSLVQEEIEAWRKNVEAEQLKLDSPENYIMENLLCQSVDSGK